jgi:mannose-6-phosphate isomerase-like protein (cupin superfamily)
MTVQSINLQEKLARFTDVWRPKVIAELNDYQLKLVKLEGEFVWHAHQETDELFLCIAGEFDIQFRDHAVTLKAGELYVVPKGVEHRPVAATECHALLLEPRGVVNTGAADSELQAPNDEWI